MHTIAGKPLSRYTCRATSVAAGSLDFIAFCRCSTGVALHPLKILVSHPPPPVPGGVAPKFGSEKVSRYTGVSQLQLRVSRYTVQLRIENRSGPPGEIGQNRLELDKTGSNSGRIEPDVPQDTRIPAEYDCGSLSTKTTLRGRMPA